MSATQTPLLEGAFRVLSNLFRVHLAFFHHYAILLTIHFPDHAANREERKNKVLNSKVYVMIFFMINILSFFKLRSSYHQLKLTIFLINTADRAPPRKGPLL